MKDNGGRFFFPFFDKWKIRRTRKNNSEARFPLVEMGVSLGPPFCAAGGEDFWVSFFFSLLLLRVVRVRESQSKSERDSRVRESRT